MPTFAAFARFAALLLLPGLASAQTIRLEAENARLEGPTLTVVKPAPDASQPDDSPPQTAPRTGYSGAGYVTGFTANSSRLVFHADAPADGLYDLRIAYASDRRKDYSLEVNGLKMSGTFSPTDERAFAVKQAGRVELVHGANSIALGRGWGYFDIDYIELTPSAPPSPLLKPPATPVDPQATAAAGALLARLDATYGSGTLLGVYSDSDAKYVLDTTGFRPAIMGGDLSPYSPASVEHGGKANGETERLIARAVEGYAVTLSWHWVAPYGLIDAMLPDPKGGAPIDARWYKGFYTNATTFDLAAAMEAPDSKEYAALLRDVDAIALQLKKLDAAGVPVLWRPLHEAEGGWFWWGAKGPTPFIALWRLLYDRLVRVDGVHNLIWVYTSGGDPAWYPGDDYVDIVAIDAYPDDLRDPQVSLWDRLLTQFAGRKLLAISEYGGVPDIPHMQRLGVRWAYAVSWSRELGPRKNTPEALRGIYNSDGALKMPEVER